MQAAYTAKELDATVLAWRTMCAAHQVRNDQSAFRAISAGPASPLSADHEDVRLLKKLVVASPAANHQSQSTGASQWEPCTSRYRLGLTICRTSYRSHVLSPDRNALPINRSHGSHRRCRLARRTFKEAPEALCRTRALPLVSVCRGPARTLPLDRDLLQMYLEVWLEDSENYCF
jgi:hypothetical protein